MTGSPNLDTLQELFVLAKFKDALRISKQYLLDIIEQKGIDDSTASAVGNTSSDCDISIMISSNDQQGSSSGQHESSTISSLIAIYLQCIFELERISEVDTAFSILRALAPIRLDCGILWAKLLLTVDKMEEAERILTYIRSQFLAQPESECSLPSMKDCYVIVLELLIFDVMLPSGRIEEALRAVDQDDKLSDDAKAMYVDAIEGHRITCPCDDPTPSKIGVESVNVASPIYETRPVNVPAARSLQKSSQHLSDIENGKKPDVPISAEMPVPPMNSGLLITGGVAAVSVVVAIAAFRNRVALKQGALKAMAILSNSLEDVNLFLFGSH